LPVSSATAARDHVETASHCQVSALEGFAQDAVLVGGQVDDAI
jgi:hypothetical protein